VGKQQVKDGIWIVIREHVNHKAVPAVGPRRLFDRERYLYREWGGHRVQRQYADGAWGCPGAANFLRRQVGDVIGLFDSRLYAGKRFRLQALRAVQRAGYRHQ